MKRLQDQPPQRAPERGAAPMDEPEIDEILADSFPASDPPPWTPGRAIPSRRIAAAPRRKRGEDG